MITLHRGMKNFLSLLLPCLAMTLVACSTTAPQATTTTFVIVRHAEKGTDDTRDPSLSEAGRTRAQALARLLADAPLAAAYATAYRRTQQTAAPAAGTHGLEVIAYYAQLSAGEFASRLRATHHGGTILVVGHSNTVPDIAAALSQRATEPMPEEAFDRLYRVTIAADGTATLSVERY